MSAPRTMSRLTASLALALLAGGCVEVPQVGPAAGGKPLLSGGAVSAPVPTGTAGPQGALLAGRLAEARGRWDEAYAQYAAAAARDPHDEEALVSQARALHALGRHSEAAMLLHGAVEREPGSVPLLRAAGASVLALGSPSMACEYYRHALERAPGDLGARADYAWALHLDGQHDAVLAILTGVAEDELPGHVRLALGRSALAHGDTAMAVRNLDAWLTAAPDDLGARLDLARAQYLARQDEQVLRSIGSVLARRPGDAQAYALLGHLRARAGQHDLAVRSYEEALRNGADRLALLPLMERSRLALAGGGGADAFR